MESEHHETVLAAKIPASKGTLNRARIVSLTAVIGAYGFTIFFVAFISRMLRLQL